MTSSSDLVTILKELLQKQRIFEFLQLIISTFSVFLASSFTNIKQQYTSACLTSCRNNYKQMLLQPVSLFSVTQEQLQTNATTASPHNIAIAFSLATHLPLQLVKNLQKYLTKSVYYISNNNLNKYSTG